MKWWVALLALGSACELADQAARRPGELRAEAVAKQSREELILRTFFTEDFAQRKIAHLAISPLEDFDTVFQPRPRIADAVAEFGSEDSVVEIDLSRFGIRDRAKVYRFGRLGLATPLNRTDGEIFWIIISAESPHR